eukprot:7425589-Alexandrium_andersonii.AAC.1
MLQAPPETAGRAESPQWLGIGSIDQRGVDGQRPPGRRRVAPSVRAQGACLLYTSDAADDM